MNQTIVLIFQLLILIMSVVIHEVTHGWMAYKLGDPTAKDYGRLTLNPIAHLDFVGSFIVPLLLWFASAGNFVFGWAKPVPYNPYNLKDQKRDPALVAIAGPVSNFLIALFFGLVFRLLWPVLLTASKAELILQIFQAIIVINIVLAIFNLIPIPPLDGSKILFALLPPSAEDFKHTLERYGFAILLAFLIIDSYIPILSAIINFALFIFSKTLGISRLF